MAWLLPEEFSERARALRRRLLAVGESFIAPSLLFAEVPAVLRRNVYMARIDSALGDDAFESFKQFAIEYHGHESLIDSAWALGKQLNAVRTYDMLYLALAKRENCDLWTLDRRLMNLVRDSTNLVRWAGDVEEDDDQPA